MTPDLLEQAWIGLGGNLGDVAAALAFSRRRLGLLSRGPLVVSGVWESEPWGVTGQPAYLNQVVGLRPRTSDARAFLDALHRIERACGRRREERWGARTLDLDLLSWPRPGEWPGVELPHPRLAERRFVLAPWEEVAGDLPLPGLGTVAELLAACADPCWVRRCS